MASCYHVERRGGRGGFKSRLKQRQWFLGKSYLKVTLTFFLFVKRQKSGFHCLPSRSHLHALCTGWGHWRVEDVSLTTREKKKKNLRRKPNKEVSAGANFSRMCLSRRRKEERKVVPPAPPLLDCYEAGGMRRGVCGPAQGWPRSLAVAERRCGTSGHPGLCVAAVGCPWDGTSAPASGCWTTRSGSLSSDEQLHKLTAVTSLVGSSDGLIQLLSIPIGAMPILVQ